MDKKRQGYEWLGPDQKRAESQHQIVNTWIVGQTSEKYEWPIQIKFLNFKEKSILRAKLNNYFALANPVHVSG